MPTYHLEVDAERDRQLRELAALDHRPVLWQAERLLAEAIDQSREPRAREPAEAVAS
jgi:hypothetical protein